MFKFKYFTLFSITLLLISCSGSDDDDGISTLEATVTSSNDAPLYDETYTISWESNASQCYATSTTGSWLGELAPSGSQDFVAKRGGTANYGVQCRKSINFVNASTDVVVSKDFIDYLVIDNSDRIYEDKINKMGIKTLIQEIKIKDDDISTQLASSIIKILL